MIRKQNGFAPLQILLIIILVGLIGGVGWFVWQAKNNTAKTADATTQGAGEAVKSTAAKVTNFDECKKAGNPIQESYPEVCKTKDGKSFTNTTQPVQQYLIIKEWGIRIPVSKTDNDDDMTYAYKKTDSYESVFFTFKRLQDYGICKTDIGVALSRQTTENKPPYDIDNPETFKKVGTYWYTTTYGGSYCYNADNKTETDFYNSTKITSKTVTDALKKLEAIPQ